MPASFLKRHRTICEVLEEIRAMADNEYNDKLIALVDEAKTYAQAMSAKLTEYKLEKMKEGEGR